MDGQYNKMKKSLIYTRVSDPSQIAGFSLDVQRERCSKWAKDNDYEIAGIYEDGGKSGTKTVGRHGLEDLLIRCQQGDIDVILVIDTDRFARSELTHYILKEELRKLGTKIIAVNQPMIDDSAEGMLMENTLIGINAFYSRLTGRKVRKSLMKKWEDGDYPSWAPLGYLNVNKGTEDKPHKVVEIDPKLGSLVKKLFELYSTGNFSLVQLSKEMFSKGLTARDGKMFSDSSLQQLLSSTFYYGWMKWGGMEKTGNHTPLITKTLFDQCLLVAAKHRQFMTRDRKHDFLLRGIVFCSKHNSRFTAEWHYYHHEHYKKDKIGYYHCYSQGGCPGSFIEVNELEKRVANLFKKFQFSQEFIELVRQKVREHFENGKKNLDSERQAIINNKKAIEEHRNKMESLLIDGVIDRDVFQRQHSKLQEQIDSLNNQLVELEGQQKLDINFIDEVLALTRNIYKTYLEAPPHLKRHYLKFFFESIYVKDKKITKVVETPIFATLRRQNHIINLVALLRRQDSNL